MEVDINGETYLIGQLKSRQQRNLLRRLVPLLTATAPLVPELIKAMDEEFGGGVEDFMEHAGPLATALSSMSDADSDYIFDTCLAACKRKVTGGWQNVIATTGDLMFQDIKIPQQMQLLFAVCKENFSDFFPERPGQSQGEGAPAQRLN